MIKSFKDTEVERFFEGESVRRFKAFEVSR